METFDRTAIRAIKQDMRDALESVAEKHGISIEVPVGGSFYPTRANVKVEVSTFGEDGQAKSKKADDFAILATRYGLDPSDLGRTFKQGRHTFTVIGLNPRAHKFPINCDRDDGKKFKFPSSTVKYALSG